MKKESLLVSAFLLALSCSVQAETADGRLYTPYERAALNEKKAEAYPELRGRWKPQSRRPASTQAYLADNLAQQILEHFRTDADVVDLAVRLKISSVGGAVMVEGVVNNEAERALIERKIRSVRGVKKIESKLRIKFSNEELLRS